VYFDDLSTLNKESLDATNAPQMPIVYKRQIKHHLYTKIWQRKPPFMKVIRSN